MVRSGRFHHMEAGSARRDGAPISVHDASGRRIRVLSGRTWDGRDQLGRLVGAGVYFVRESGPDAAGPAKVIVVR